MKSGDDGRGLISSRNQHGQVNSVNKSPGTGQEPLQSSPGEASEVDGLHDNNCAMGGDGSSEPVVWLEVWQEAAGVLLGVDRVYGVLCFQGFKVMVPPRELYYQTELENLIGYKIAILRTDLPHRPILQRTIKPPQQVTKHHTAKETIDQEPPSLTEKTAGEESP